MTLSMRHRDTLSRRLCRAGLSLALAVTILVSSLLPHTASALSLPEAAEISTSATGPQPDRGTAGPDDYGVVQHTGCACTTTVPARVEVVPVPSRPGLVADYPGPAQSPPGRSLSALPFKPPRV